MSVHFFLGGSGSGKSRQLANLIIDESMAHPDRQYFVIVPEQSTLQTQKLYVALHPRMGLLNIDVVSFQRLAHRVLEETGAEARTVLGDTGKSFVLQNIASDLKDELKVFGRNFKKQGYVGQMKSLLSEMAQYRIKGERLSEVIDLCDEGSSLKLKLQDIALLQESFDEFLGETYITGEELLERLGRFVNKSGMLKDAVLVFDGFTGFTPVQMELLRELFKAASDIYITADMDDDQDPFKDPGVQGLFHLSCEMCCEVMKLCQELHITVEEPVRMAHPYPRFNGNKELLYLENNIFRRRVPAETDAVAPVPDDEKGRGITLHRLRNPMEEARFAASLITDQVRNNGVRYRDMAVILGSMEEYATYVNSVFGEWNIPFFLDRNRSALSNILVEYIRAAVGLIENRYSYDAMFRFLKVGLHSIDEDDVFLMENYCLAMGIKGYKKWHEPWTSIIRHSNEEEADKALELAHLNTVKDQLMTSLISYETAMRRTGRTVEDAVQALYDLLVSQNIEEIIKERADSFEASGNLALAREYRKVYPLVMDLFDQMVLLLGNTNVTVAEFRQILDAGLEELKIGVIPPGMDQVMVGDIERSRIDNVKYVICLGFNDKYLPGISAGTSIINDREKNFLWSKGVKLSLTVNHKSFIQKFYLYLNLTKPSEHLHICMSNVDAEGKALNPGYYVWEIRRLFKGIEITDEVPFDRSRDIAVHRNAALNYLAFNAGERDDTWKELYSFYARRGDDEFLKLLIDAHLICAPSEQLSGERARQIYGKLLKGSVTRLETYARCPYRFFLQYGLKLNERDEYGFEAVDEGSVMHEALYNYGVALKEMGLDWDKVSPETTDILLKDALDKAVNNYGNSVLSSTARLSYVKKRLAEDFRITVWALKEQLKAGKFRPEGFEVEFGRGSLKALEIPIDDETSMMLSGKIDRIDLAQQGDNTYVKILDYKTGSQSYDLTAVYKGLDLQLFAYLDVALEYVEKNGGGGDVIPAGVLYYHITDPILDKKAGMDIDDSRMKELRPDGPINSDMKVLEMFDSEFESGDHRSGSVIRQGLKTDGSFTAASKVLTDEEFSLITGHVRKTMQDFGREIVNGKIDVSPCAGIKNGCQYCGFSAICGFDNDIDGYEARIYTRESDESILMRLHAEE